MIQLLMTLLLPVIASASGEASLLVGNAGEGVVVNGVLYVRDLYEAGAHEKPQFRSVPISPELETAVANLAVVRDLNVAPGLLAAKIAELDEYSPDFAAYFLTVARYYHWVLLDTLFLPFPSDGEFLKLQRLPLANRLNGTIRIEKFAWNNLSAENRVALIVHEVFSAMQKLFWDGKGAWSADAPKLREIVGILFSTYPDKESRFRVYANTRMSLPSEDYRRAHPGVIKSRISGYLTPQGYYQDTMEFLAD